jgi:hypothetical protein
MAGGKAGTFHWQKLHSWLQLHQPGPTHQRRHQQTFALPFATD